MRPAPVALVIDDGDAANADGQSLQERFEVMRQRRVAAAQRVKAAEAAKKSAPRSDSFKKALRERFVAQARTYVGTPYSAKRNSAIESGRAAVDVQISDETGQAEVDVQWDAQLYLDCCGLVRRTAHDLKEELGFELGCWNQSYQFDTLPTAIEDAAPLPVLGAQHLAERRLVLRQRGRAIRAIRNYGNVFGIEVPLQRALQITRFERQQGVVIAARQIETAIGFPRREIRGLPVHALEPTQPARLDDALRASHFTPAKSHRPGSLQFAPEVPRGIAGMRSGRLHVRDKHPDVAGCVVPR